MRKQKNNNRIIIRGPESIPPEGTRAWYEYAAGRRFYESPLPGQHFPEGASQKELDRLAEQRGDELAREAGLSALANIAYIQSPDAVQAVETKVEAATETEAVAA